MTKKEMIETVREIIYASYESEFALRVLDTNKEAIETAIEAIYELFEKEIKEETKEFLTDEEKKVIKMLNFIATYDGVILSEDERIYLLKQGVEKFIPKKRQHLVSITETAYPVRIVY